MWILSLIYNETTSHRTLRVNSTTRVGRNHDYKKDPDCVYIADLKVPKTYVTIKVGRQDLTSDKSTVLSVRFESICTTDINGSIYKLAKKDADPFEQTFCEDDLLIKVNANKSDRIKIRLRWMPIVVLPFLKKILFDGVIQRSPLPEAISELQSSGVDVKTTDDPFRATHYVTLTDLPDYNLQIAVLRAIPVVSKAWCEFLATSIDEVDKWLFEIPPDMYVHDTRGNDILPNPARTTFLHGVVTAIITDDIHSKQLFKLREWLGYLSDSEVIVKDISQLKDLQIELESRSSSSNYYVFRAFSGNSEPAHFPEETNTSDELWSAIVTLDSSKLRKAKSLFFDSLVSEKRSLDQHKEPTPVSQRRKRRKLERVEDTNFFLFTPLLSSKPQPETLNSELRLCLPVSQLLEPNLNFELAQSHDIQPEQDDSPFKNLEIDNLQGDQDVKTELVTQPVLETIPKIQSKGSTVIEKVPRQRSQNDLLESENDLLFPPKKKQKPANWIVPEVSLADAIKSTKQQADDNIKQELAIDDSVESQLGKLLVIEDFELQPTRRNSPQTNGNLFHGRKNFKNFRKNGPRQNNITRTFIELVDNGNAVYFKDQFSPPIEEEASERLQNDFATEMEDVRGFQPEPPQLFVDQESDDENAGESFQFLSRRNDPSSASRLASSHGVVNASANQGQILDGQDEDDDDDEGDVRFRFSRRS